MCLNCGPTFGCEPGCPQYDPSELVVFHQGGQVRGESWLDDDDGPMVIAVEAGEQPQALWVRVGPVFDDGARRDEPGVWVEYQPVYLGSHAEGPVLLSPATWRQLASAVEKRLARHDKPRRSWRPWRRG